MSLDIFERVQHFWRDDAGQDLIEYALLVGLVAVVAVVGVTKLGTTIRDVLWSVIASSIP